MWSREDADNTQIMQQSRRAERKDARRQRLRPRLKVCFDASTWEMLFRALLEEVPVESQVPFFFTSPEMCWPSPLPCIF